MKTTSKSKTGNGNKAQAALAQINARIAALQQERVGLAEPLKSRYVEMRAELLQVETEIRDLDPSWKPAPLKPKADDKIREILAANRGPMTAEEIVKAVGNLFTPWKTKNTLKKKSQGVKAVFVVNDGKYSVKV
jgi:hypothetical protein